MPYAKTSTGYPPELFEILDSFAEGSVVKMECATEKHARGQRAKWYQFLGALKRDLTKPPVWMKTEAEQAKLLSRTRDAMAIEVVLEGRTLTFRPRTLRNVVISVIEGAAIAPPKADESIAKLLAIQAEVLKGEKK